MIKYIDSKNMGKSELGWLDSTFHFSFAEYYNPDNVNFGALRVINDDLIKAGTGFDTHPHENMEIITYVIDGELTHADSMGNKKSLTKGQSQYMSAGTGITHSEHNYGDKTLRLMQIWIFPDYEGYTPTYGDEKFNFPEDRQDKWLHIATDYKNKDINTPIKIHQDINMYATLISKGNKPEFKVAKGRQAYLVLIEGSAEISGVKMNMRDALEITEEDITIEALTDNVHVLVIEMEKRK